MSLFGWRRMRSGDWKLSVPWQQWAVAFVWRTADQGYAWAANGHQTSYSPRLSTAKRSAGEQFDGQLRHR